MYMNKYDKYDEGDEFSLKWWLLFLGIAILAWGLVLWLGWYAISGNLGDVEGKDLVANQ